DALENVAVYPWNTKGILPQVLKAGEHAGTLTQQGASLLDVNGNLQSGSMMAPPERHAGTGIVSTNRVRQHTGSVSVGTSAFSMVALDKPLKKIYRDSDIVTTPNNDDVAMVHINNCSSEIDAWIGIFRE